MTTRGYAAIGLQEVQKDGNFGGLLRAAHCYGVGLVVIAGRFIREVTDTTKAYRHIPVLQGQDDVFSAIPFDCVPVAVDLLPDAESLVTFKHPERAYYIFGPEAGTLGKKITDRCKYKVYVPTNYCMNLAATVNVVLYDRLAKSLGSSGVERQSEALRVGGASPSQGANSLEAA